MAHLVWVGTPPRVRTFGLAYVPGYLELRDVEGQGLRCAPGPPGNFLGVLAMDGAGASGFRRPLRLEPLTPPKSNYRVYVVQTSRSASQVVQQNPCC